MEEVYRLAEQNIAIRTLYEDFHTFCREYRTDGAPDFTVTVTPEDIAFELEKSIREDHVLGRPVRTFPAAYLEEQAVYRKIAEKMPDYQTFLFHGSAIAVEGDGYLFAAPSGTGKSTHARLWRELLGDRAVMVNDDKPLLRVTDTGVVVYGTPWDGKHRLSCNLAVPLKGLCVLERAEGNAIRPLTASEVWPVLLQQVYRPAEGAALQKTLRLLDRLTAMVPLWRLSCNMEPDAAAVAYQTLREGEKRRGQ